MKIGPINTHATLKPTANLAATATRCATPERRAPIDKTLNTPFRDQMRAITDRPSLTTRETLAKNTAVPITKPNEQIVPRSLEAPGKLRLGPKG